jgi:hypothetical protein
VGLRCYLPAAHCLSGGREDKPLPACADGSCCLCGKHTVLRT